ncbi:MAG TPA: 5'/3'-nucleotidase SurE [Anaerolineae bacterium]
MPQILLTNDDGYQSPALRALAQAMAALGQVTVFAPDHNWSAAGHTKTMHKPLRIKRSETEDGFPLYVTTGTPSDCVGLALLGVVPQRPDLVISGINLGPNLGEDITYSGTVAGAMEAAVAGLPALAASQDLPAEGKSDFVFAAGVVAEIAGQVLRHGLPQGSLLNINFPALPARAVKGVQVTRLGRRVYHDVLIERLDPRGRPYYWIGGDPPAGEPEAGTDLGAVAHGYVSVTPLRMDMTDHRQLAEVSGWGLHLPGDAG